MSHAVQQVRLRRAQRPWLARSRVQRLQRQPCSQRHSCALLGGAGTSGTSKQSIPDCLSTSLLAFPRARQAVGRVIRHRRDYGAIILADERFRQPVRCRSTCLLGSSVTVRQTSNTKQLASLPLSAAVKACGLQARGCVPRLLAPSTGSTIRPALPAPAGRAAPAVLLAAGPGARVPELRRRQQLAGAVLQAAGRGGAQGGRLDWAQPEILWDGGGGLPWMCPLAGLPGCMEVPRCKPRGAPSCPRRPLQGLVDGGGQAVVPGATRAAGGAGSRPVAGPFQAVATGAPAVLRDPPAC